MTLSDLFDPNALHPVDNHYFKWPSTSTKRVFTLFPQLPKELRLVVWEHTLPEPVVVKVKCMATGLEVSRGTSDDMKIFLNLCNESRQIYKAHYCQLDIWVQTRRVLLYIDEARDILLMDPSTSAKASRGEIKIDLTRIQNIAMGFLPTRLFQWEHEYFFPSHFTLSHPIPSRRPISEAVPGHRKVLTQCLALRNLYLVLNEFSDSFFESNSAQNQTKRLVDTEDLERRGLKRNFHVESLHRVYFHEYGPVTPSRVRFVDFSNREIDSIYNVQDVRREFGKEMRELKITLKNVTGHTSFICLLEKEAEVHYWAPRNHLNSSSGPGFRDVDTKLQYSFLKLVSNSDSRQGNIFRDILRET